MLMHWKYESFIYTEATLGRGKSCLACRSLRIGRKYVYRVNGTVVSEM